MERLPPTIHFCLYCCTKNRFDPSKAAQARCGQCGKPVYPDKFHKIPQRTAQRPTGKRSLPKWRTVVNLVRFAALLGVILFIYDISEDTSTPTVASEDLPPPMVGFPGVYWNKTGREPLAPFEILTKGDSDFFVKLVEQETGEDAVAIFAPANQTIEVAVPLGTYKMRYATGDTWRGEQHLFGPGRLTSFSEAAERFVFERRNGYLSGYTVELFRQPNGNLPTRRIKANDF